jgi:hypothetical protein
VTPLQVVYAVVALIAAAVCFRLWMSRRNARIVKTYLQVFQEVQGNCITAEPFFRYLCHLKAVIATRSKDEVLQFDTSPGKLLESYVKQQMRNADPEYKLFDERLCWQRKTFPPAEINLPATPWMNEFVMRLDQSRNGPASVSMVVSRLDDAIDCVRDLPQQLQVVPGISNDGKVGVHLEEQPRARVRREYVRGYLMLAALWCLHSALLLTHGRTWAEVLAAPERLILAFAPPLGGYVLMRIAFWVRPLSRRASQAEEAFQGFSLHSLRQEAPAADNIRAGASMRASAGR